MSTNAPHTDPNHRHDFVALVEAVDSNINGDPDDANRPRTDPQTGIGLVSDVCVKRHIRDYVSEVAVEADPADPRFDIYVQAGVALNTRHAEAAAANPLPPVEGAKKEKDTRLNLGAQEYLCNRFYDVRMFGAVMSTGDNNCGQVRGPVQIRFGRSVDPIDVAEHTITRVTVTKEDDLAKKVAGEKGGKDREMGSKFTVPYGLYVIAGSYSAPVAARTGVDSSDLELLWEALANMWEASASAARPNVATRALHVFSHPSARGNAPTFRTIGAVQIAKNQGVEYPRSFEDYTVSVGDVPSGIIHTSLV